MAIKLGSTKENIKVIIREDDSLAEDLTASEWDSYRQTLDETKLRFVEGKKPTRFIMTKHLSYSAQQSIANQQMGLSESGKPEIKMGFILEEIRCALVNIENPDILPDDQKIIFKKESDGFASKELIAELNSAGIISELYALRQANLQGNSTKK